MQERGAAYNGIAAVVAYGEDISTLFSSCRLALFFSVL
jgi:hypothetical protein